MKSDYNNTFKLLAFFLMIAFTSTHAQTDQGMLVFCGFDNFLVSDELNNANVSPLIPGTISEFPCGVQGKSLKIGGNSPVITIGGNEVNQLLRDGDFTLSFYFKATGNANTFTLLSKQNNCNTDSSIVITYASASKTIACKFIETQTKSVLFQQKVDEAACWQMLTITRENTKMKFYINGLFKWQKNTPVPYNFRNEAPIFLGGSPCNTSTDNVFDGHIDEFRLYNRALNAEEVAGLYFKPDKITNQDISIVLGNTVSTTISTSTCASLFNWNPVSGVGNPQMPNTTIKPSVLGKNTYILSFNDGSCVAYDTINITTTDPALVGCELFLPNAFSPNGDGTNDVFGISNPAAVQQIISFDVFSRWGNKMFSTNNPNETWNGNFENKPVESGTYMFIVKYKCNGKELIKNGNINLIR